MATRPVVGRRATIDNMAAISAPSGSAEYRRVPVSSAGYTPASMVRVGAVGKGSSAGTQVAQPNGPPRRRTQPDISTSSDAIQRQRIPQPDTPTSSDAVQRQLDEMKPLMAQAKDMTQQIADLTNENASMKQQLAQMLPSIGEVAQLKQQLAQVRQTNSQTGNTISSDAVQRQLDEMKAALVQANQMTQGLTQQIAELKAENCDMKQQLGQMAPLVNQVERSGQQRAESAQLAEEVTQLKQQLSQLQSKVKRCENELAEHEQTKEDLRSMKCEMKQAQIAVRDVEILKSDVSAVQRSAEETTRAVDKIRDLHGVEVNDIGDKKMVLKKARDKLEADLGAGKSTQSYYKRVFRQALCLATLLGEAKHVPEDDAAEKMRLSMKQPAATEAPNAERIFTTCLGILEAWKTEERKVGVGGQRRDTIRIEALKETADKLGVAFQLEESTRAYYSRIFKNALDLAVALDAEEHKPGFSSQAEVPASSAELPPRETRVFQGQKANPKRIAASVQRLQSLLKEVRSERDVQTFGVEAVQRSSVIRELQEELTRCTVKMDEQVDKMMVLKKVAEILDVDLGAAERTQTNHKRVFRQALCLAILLGEAEHEPEEDAAEKMGKPKRQPAATEVQRIFSTCLGVLKAWKTEERKVGVGGTRRDTIRIEALKGAADKLGVGFPLGESTRAYYRQIFKQALDLATFLEAEENMPGSSCQAEVPASSAELPPRETLVFQGQKANPKRIAASVQRIQSLLKQVR